MSKLISRNLKIDLEAKGFKFVLLGMLSQIQMLLIDYCKIRLSADAELAKNFYILFYELFTIVPGKSYTLCNCSDELKRVLYAFMQFLNEVGIAQCIDSHWYVTPLIKKIFQSEKHIYKSVDHFLIIETNFKIYAYTTNPLYLKVLQYISHIEYQFPNMIVSLMTQSTVKNALKK